MPASKKELHQPSARGPMLAWIVGGASAAAVSAGAALALVLQRKLSKRRDVALALAPAPIAAEAKPVRRTRALIVTWLLAWASAGVIGGGAALAVVEFGLFDATASMPHRAIVGWAAHKAFITSVKRRAGTVAAPIFTPGEVKAGFIQYDHDCAMCHGGPGVARAAFVAGMTPTPPYVITAAHHWTPGQLYWILAQGVKMTAMPSWRASRTNAQLWNVVAFLEALPYISPKQYADMRAAESSAEPSKAAGSTDVMSAGPAAVNRPTQTKP